MAIDRLAALLDRIDGVRRDALPLVGDGGVEAGEIDHPQRLRAEHERIVLHALAVDLGFHRELADQFQAAARILVDAAVEQARRDHVLGLLQRAAQRHHAGAAAVIVLRRPVMGGDAGDRRQRDAGVLHQRVGLQALVKRGEIDDRLDRRAGLPQRLRGAVELAGRIGEAADHRQDAAGLVFQHHRGALHLGAHAQLGASRRPWSCPRLTRT